MYGWSDADWLTLQLGPVWVISALIGRNHFDELEREAFWEAVADAPRGTSALSWQLAQSISRNRECLFDEFLLDDRSIVSGLGRVTRLLERAQPEVSRETREFMLRIGAAVARARGPFGRRMTDQDSLTLQLVEQLLESDAETAENNPLNADIAI